MPNWRKDKKIIQFNFLKKYCPHKIKTSLESGDFYCPIAPKRPRKYSLCRAKNCPIWIILEDYKECSAKE